VISILIYNNVDRNALITRTFDHLLALFRRCPIVQLADQDQCWMPDGPGRHRVPKLKKSRLFGRPSSWKGLDYSSVDFLTASFTSPATLCAAPFALSIFPSVCSFLSPVILPAVSLMAPLALSAAPFTCSRSIFALLSENSRGEPTRAFE